MSHREIEVRVNGTAWHVGKSHFRVEHDQMARLVTMGDPVVRLDVPHQLVTPDELRRLADEIDRRYARRSFADSDTSPDLSAGGTD